MSQALLDQPVAVDPDRLEQLVDLFHLRWNVSLLAALHENRALGRVVVLGKRLDVGRSTVSRTLHTLSDHAWVQHNAGYGHPLRPEFVLTANGVGVAAWCLAFERSLRRRPALRQLAYQKWPMLVLWAVGSGREHFAQIEQVLGTISPRALSGALKDLCAAGLLRREVLDSTPVRVRYRPERPARALLARLAEFFA